MILILDDLFKRYILTHLTISHVGNSLTKPLTMDKINLIQQTIEEQQSVNG